MYKTNDGKTEDISSLLNEIVNILVKGPKELSADDLMFVLITVSLIEDGFVLLNEQYEVIDILARVSEKHLCDWKKESHVYEAFLAYSKFIDTPIKLILSPIGNTVIINIVINITSEAFSFCIPLNQYVICPETPATSIMFCNSQQLLSTLKNRLLSTVKSTILNHHGYSSASLSGLPEELLIQILLYLNISDIVNVSKTCVNLHVFIDNNEVLWSKLCKRDINHSNHVEFNNYKEHYIDTYVTKKRNEATSISYFSDIINFFHIW